MMKKILFILFAFITLLSITNSLHAQIGIKAGVNFSSLKFFDDNSEDNFNEEFITGYQVGAVYVVGLGDKLSFQPEAAFYTRGGKASLDQFTDIENTYNYLNLDGLLNYNLIGNNDGLSLRITGGVFVGYALSATATTTSGGSSAEMDIDLDTEGLDRSNVGYVLGVGVKLNKLLVSLRASIGVTEIGKIDTALGSGQTTFRSREFSLVRAYLF